MKALIILILIIYFSISFNCFAKTIKSVNLKIKNDALKHTNKLDSINSAKDIENILASIDKMYSNFKVNDSLKFNDKFKGKPDKRSQYLADSLKIKPWTKSDFDGNGYTDLLVIGNWYNPSVLCIMDKGKDDFYVIRITRRSFQSFTFPVVKSINKNPVIIYYSNDIVYTKTNDIERKLKVDTLIYKFGDFVEYNKKPLKHKIQKIEYSTGYCYGSCPVFEIKLNSDRSAVFNAKEYNSKKGTFSTIINKKDYQQIERLLNYINFPELNENYSVDWTDDQTCNLKITYDNGLVKNIQDYGLIGTFGLNRTYKLIRFLRETQEWK